MTFSWQRMTYKPSKLGQTDLVLVCDRSSSVGLCVQDYKSVCVVADCATLVNTQTHMHTDRQLFTSYGFSSAS